MENAKDVLYLVYTSEKKDKNFGARYGVTRPKMSILAELQSQFKKTGDKLISHGVILE